MELLVQFLRKLAKNGVVDDILYTIQNVTVYPTLQGMIINELYRKQSAENRANLLEFMESLTWWKRKAFKVVHLLLIPFFFKIILLFC
jgi:hypothetical protein